MEDTGNGKMWFKRVAKEWTVALRESCLKIKAGRIYTWENCQVVCKKKVRKQSGQSYCSGR